jgi:hypothetical protein
MDRGLEGRNRRIRTARSLGELEAGCVSTFNVTRTIAGEDIISESRTILNYESRLRCTSRALRQGYANSDEAGEVCEVVIPPDA